MTATNHDYLLARLMMRHYWLWLAFTTETEVLEHRRCKAIRRALDAIGVLL